MPALPADDSRPCAEGGGQEKESQGCRVYVGNLAWGVRSEDLKEHMQGVGEVVRANVFEDFQGRSRGCGIVVYKDEESAQRAIKELTDSHLRERPIFVREDREESTGRFAGSRGGRGGRMGYDSRGGRAYSGYSGGSGGGGSGGTRQVFVSNLPWKTSWQDLKDIFRECGEVLRADVMEMPDGRSRGIGTVLFASPESAQRAVDTLNNTPLDGRNISVRFDRKEL